MKLFASYGNEKTNSWEALKEIELRPYSELYPEQSKMIPRIPGMEMECWGLNNEGVTLPEGEEIRITVAYTPVNRGLSHLGLRSKDALHISCAVSSGCRYFLTTDDQVLNKRTFIDDLVVADPISFIREVYS